MKAWIGKPRIASPKMHTGFLAPSALKFQVFINTYDTFLTDCTEGSDLVKVVLDIFLGLYEMMRPKAEIT